MSIVTIEHCMVLYRAFLQPKQTVAGISLIANLSEIFILSEVRKYMSYSDKTVIISKFPTN